MKIVWIGLISVLFLAICSGIVAAQDKVGGPFCLERNASGCYIPIGSVVHHFANGTTVVYGSSGKVIMKINDSNAPELPTPAGKMVTATHIFVVPSGSVICSKGNVTRVYKNGKLILTVVGPKKATKAQVPATAYNGWIEDANNWSISSLGYFNAYWYVPTQPPSPEAVTVDFLFNAIEPNTGAAIIQPVLEWNWGGSGSWTAASWAGPDASGNYYRSTPISVSTGDTLEGHMIHGPNGWLVEVNDISTGDYTYLYSNLIGTNNLAVFVALEGYGIYDNTDVPGSTLFYQMSFYDPLWTPVNVKWSPWISTSTPLTGLNVTIYSSSCVGLETAN